MEMGFEQGAHFTGNTRRGVSFWAVDVLASGSLWHLWSVCLMSVHYLLFCVVGIFSAGLHFPFLMLEVIRESLEC